MPPSPCEAASSRRASRASPLPAANALVCARHLAPSFLLTSLTLSPALRLTGRPPALFSSWAHSTFPPPTSDKPSRGFGLPQASLHPSPGAWRVVHSLGLRSACAQRLLWTSAGGPGLMGFLPRARGSLHPRPVPRPQGRPAGEMRPVLPLPVPDSAPYRPACPLPGRELFSSHLVFPLGTEPSSGCSRRPPCPTTRAPL